MFLVNCPEGALSSGRSPGRRVEPYMGLWCAERVFEHIIHDDVENILQYLQSRNSSRIAGYSQTLLG